MAYGDGTLSLSGNLNVAIGKPLDARHIVEHETDLTSSSTWTASGANYAYEGVMVYCKDTHKTMQLQGSADYSVASNWVEVGAGGNGSIDYRLNEEQNTGNTWINGKPIYRRIFRITLDNAYSGIVCDLSSFDTDEVIRIDGSLHITNLTALAHWPISFVSVSESTGDFQDSFCIASRAGQTELKWMSHQKRNINTYAYVILEYTKTTDNATIVI